MTYINVIDLYKCEAPITYDITNYNVKSFNIKLVNK